MGKFLWRVMETEFTHRQYNPYEDYEMVCHWWLWHDREPVSPLFLPSYGLVAEDDAPIAAAWLFFDTSTPTAFLAHAVTRPNLSVEQAVNSLQSLIEPFKIEARISGAAVMAAYVPKAIARYLSSIGFIEDQHDLANLSIVLQEEIVCPF
jgi:hypothetical protein